MRQFQFLVAFAALVSAPSAAAMPVVRVEPPALPAKGLQAAAADKRGGRIEFAVPVATAFGLADGQWTLAAPDTRTWSLAIRSPGALNLNLKLSGLQLPGGAELYLSSADGSQRHGPYRAGQLSDGTLWTPVVNGDTARLEIHAPAAVADRVALRVARVHHGYRDFLTGSPAKMADPGIGTSGSCNIDVRESQGDNHRDVIRSVVRLQIDGSSFCTGFMVNNVRQDEDPLVLTADHCEIGTDGAGSVDGADASPASVVAYFNLDNRSCVAGQPSADLTQTISGSSFLADDVGSDFTLLRLNSAPPQEYNVFFAGFDASTSTPTDGVGVHHPSGDVKKISVYTNSATRSQVDLGGGRIVDAWQLVWNQGTTEPGSSGSPLFNTADRAVGVLTGGSASCSNTSGVDFYGRFEEAWQAGANTDEQLKPHLDSTNSGILTLAGRTQAIGNISPIALGDCDCVDQATSGNPVAVLANDSDPNGDTLSISAVGTPDNGGSVIISGTQLSYTPDAGFTGTETFSYTVQDPNGLDDTGTVTMTVIPSDLAPVAANDVATVQQDSSSNVLNVLANDSDSSCDDSLSITAVGGFSNGGAASIAGNTVRYTPAAGFSGTETFSYTVSDNGGLTDTATVTVTVQARSSGGGGGVWAPGSLLLLLLAAGLRRARRQA